MDQTYYAKLSATPNVQDPSHDHNHGHEQHQDQNPHNPNDPINSGGGPQVLETHYHLPLMHGPGGDTIPIVLPNIRIHTAPNPPNRERSPSPPRQPRRPVPPFWVPPPTPPITENLKPREGEGSRRWIGLRWSRPHPLLWLSLALSLIALVLEVPKGALPTITGRHRAIRTQEKLVQEKLRLLTQLSTFFPPPLSALVAPLDPANPIPTSLLALRDHEKLEFLRLAPHLRFWNAAAGSPFGVGVGQEDGERWWSVEQLGEGSSVVRSKGEGQEREVWVIRMNGEGQEDTPQTAALTSALTHSLLLRDRLQSEVHALKTRPCPVCPAPPPSVPAAPTPPTHYHLDQEDGHVRAVKEGGGDAADEQARREEWKRLEEWRTREKKREREVEEREREVGRRERWVVEEMRKMSEKVHTQAGELTLEDRITERLKQYQRQLRDHEGHTHTEL